MIRRSIVAVVGIMVLSLLGVGIGMKAGAVSNSTLKQQVLPLDCQFTIIDSGTNQIVYLTPTECGQAVTPPQPGTGTPTQPSVDQGLSVGGAVLATPVYYYAHGAELPNLAGPYNQTNSTGDIIRLNLFPEYRKEGEAPAKRLTLAAGQPVLFSIKTITYVFMVKEITADSVTFIVYPQSRSIAYSNVLASEVFQTTLRIGEAGEYDINNDKQANIRISIIGTIANKATIDFKELKTESQKTLDTKESIIGLFWVAWLGGILIAVLAWWFIIWRRKRRKEEEERA